MSSALAGKFFTTSPTWGADEFGSILYRESLRQSLAQSEHSICDSPYSGPNCDLRHHWLLQELALGPETRQDICHSKCWLPPARVLGSEKPRNRTPDSKGQQPKWRKGWVTTCSGKWPHPQHMATPTAQGHIHSLWPHPQHMATFIAYGHTACTLIHTHISRKKLQNVFIPFWFLGIPNIKQETRKENEIRRSLLSLFEDRK